MGNTNQAALKVSRHAKTLSISVADPYKGTWDLYGAQPALRAFQAALLQDPSVTPAEREEILPSENRFCRCGVRTPDKRHKADCPKCQGKGRYIQVYYPDLNGDLAGLAIERARAHGFIVSDVFRRFDQDGDSEPEIPVRLCHVEDRMGLVLERGTPEESYAQLVQLAADTGVPLEVEPRVIAFDPGTGAVEKIAPTSSEKSMVEQFGADNLEKRSIMIFDWERKDVVEVMLAHMDCRVVE